MTESIIRKYYIDQRLSCTGTVIRTCVDCLKVSVPDETRNLLENFCTILKMDDICSAYAVTIALLHIFLVRDEFAHARSIAPDIAATLYEYYHKYFGTRKCSAIRLANAKCDVGCLHVLINTADIFCEIVGYLQTGRNEETAKTIDKEAVKCECVKK